MCYESQGYLLDPERRLRIDDGTATGLEVNRFVADKPRDRRVIYYWWTTEGLSTADVGAFRGRMAMTGALENRAWGAFVRVEALVRTDDVAADSLAADFAGRVAARLPEVFASSAHEEQGGVARR